MGAGSAGPPSPPPAHPAPPAAEAAPLDIPLPSFLRVPPPKPRRPKPPRKPRVNPLWVSWWVQVPILTCLLLADGLLGFLTARHAGAYFQQMPQERDPYALWLRVREDGDSLHLVWDRSAPAFALAQHAILSIWDGDQSRTIELSRAQLQSGSVVYRRVSGQVKFQLEVFFKERRTLSETWELRSPQGPSPPAPVAPDLPETAGKPRP